MNLRLGRYVIGAGILLTLAGTAQAVPVAADINILGGAVYNDRVGNSRFFFGANNDFMMPGDGKQNPAIIGPGNHDGCILR